MPGLTAAEQRHSQHTLGIAAQEGAMGRSWGGFLPQNEVVKLHWAAVEASCAGSAAEEFRKLLANCPRHLEEWEIDEECLPSLGPEMVDPSQRK
jgi:hypothetical protein